MMLLVHKNQSRPGQDGRRTLHEDPTTKTLENNTEDFRVREEAILCLSNSRASG